MANQGLGLEALVPNGLLGGTAIGNYSRNGLTPGVARILDALSSLPAASGASINSGYRSPSRNQKAGGAKRSQHLGGNAVDINISKLSAAQKKEVLDAAIAAGARGIGVYKSGNVLHVDPRKGATAWGPSPRGIYRGLKPGEYGLLPDWARSSVVGMLGGSAVARPQLPITPVDAPLPSPRPPSPLQSAPVSAVQRAPLGPAVPRQMTPRGSLPGVPPTDRAPIQPSVPTPSARPQPAVDPQKLAAAYQEYAASRMAAPVSGLAAGAVQVSPAVPQPPMMPQQPAAPPLGPPRQIQPRPIFNLPPEQFPSAPSMPSQPRDPFGNTWQDGPMGREVTNRFGVTTVQRPDGSTAAMGGPFSNMDTSKLGNLAKTGLGGGLGAALGGMVAGPIGGLVGGAIGREMANGRNPMSGGGGFFGGLFGGNRDPWSGTRESSGRSPSAGSSRSSTSAGSKRDSRDRPDMR